MGVKSPVLGSLGRVTRNPEVEGLLAISAAVLLRLPVLPRIRGCRRIESLKIIADLRFRVISAMFGLRKTYQDTRTFPLSQDYRSGAVRDCGVHYRLIPPRRLVNSDYGQSRD